MKKKIVNYSEKNSIFEKIVNLDCDKKEEENLFCAIPEEILEEAIFMGTGILSDKKKIHTFFLTTIDSSERIQILKEIYYYVILYTNGIFVKQLQANPMKGLLIFWKIQESERQEWVSWERVEQKITELIRKERYLAEDYCLQKRQYRSANKEEILLEVGKGNKTTENKENIESQQKLEQKKNKIEKEEKIKKQNQTSITKCVYSKESTELNKYLEKEECRYELICYVEEKKWYSIMLAELQQKIQNENSWNERKDRLCLQYHLSSKRVYSLEEHKEDEIYRLDNCYLEKEDLQKFMASLMLFDIQIRKDALTAYWRLYDKKEKVDYKERSDKIRNLERALNGTDDDITLALHKKYEFWLKKNPKLEQKYKRKRKNGREKVNVKNRNQLADLFYYIEAIEMKKIDRCIMVMPSIVIYYVEKEVLPFYPNILCKRYDIYYNRKENINIIFMTPEQFEWSGLKRKRTMEYLQSKLELVQRYIYMERHLQERNEERERYFIKVEQTLLEKIKNNRFKDMEKLELSKEKIYFYQQEEQELIILGKHLYSMPFFKF